MEHRTLFGNPAATIDRSTEVGPETAAVADTHETAETQAAVETSEQVSAEAEQAVDQVAVQPAAAPATHADVAALLRQRQEIDGQIEAARHQAMAGALGQIHALMSQHGITVKDIAKRAPKKAGAGNGAGTKVPPKYQDPLTGATWTGRGKSPKWFDAATAIKL